MTAVVQGRGGPAPIGIVYNTSMSRPDAALALAALYGFANRREARVGAVCVTGAGLATAIYCDIVNRFYTPGPPRNGNQALPVGLAAVHPLPPDAPMVQPAVARLADNGEPLYARSIHKVSDTSLAEAMLRNGVIFSAESAVVLSAPATWLARSLDLQGAKDQYRQRVRRLVIVESAETGKDPAALRKVIAEWPSPVYLSGRDVGQTLAFPGAAVGQAFGWAPAHPVADAYHAFRPMPYDAPADDLAAMFYAVHPDNGLFGVSEPGSVSVSGAGALTFNPGGGAARRITVDPARRDLVVKAFLDVLSAPPPPPSAGRGRG